MKRIRIMAAVLAIAMAAAASSGCGADSKDGGDRTTAQPAKQQEPLEETTTGSVQDAEQDEGKDDSAKASGETYRKIPDPVVKDGDKILFVGNSHTYTNDLPGMFFEMAQAGGHGVDVYDLTEGSYTLQRFSDPEDELGEILTDALQSEPWDFVVLQENTNAAVAFNAKKDMYPYARKLDEMIKAAGGQTAFLMTWAPEEGAGAFSREMVQGQLAAGYRTIAEELDALLIPGGEVFAKALEQDEELQLWGEDGQHPSVEGTYLAACTAYALLFQETPVGNPYLADLDQDKAQELQGMAQAFILDQD
ncbi:Uncharacterised protein [uncultured Clostridium sp.]|nr:Uncharacterised protein [uncultured Clostridium sp.]